METKAKIIKPMNSVRAHNLPFLSREFSIGRDEIKYPKTAAMEYKMPAPTITTPGQILAPESNLIMDDDCKIKTEPSAKQATIGSESQPAIWLSRFFCTTGFVIIPSTRLNVSDS
jgi:hypothetical protein